MFRIHEMVLSSTEPPVPNVIWIKPINFGLYKLFIYAGDGWVPISPNESKQVLINASTEYNDNDRIDILTLQQALDKVAEADKAVGKMITFFDGEKWQFIQFIGENIFEWNMVSKWVPVTASAMDYTETPIYNVTVAIPLPFQQYYTEVEARSVVPINVRKKGLIITFEIASNIWLRQQFTGDPTIEWDIPLKWKSLTDSFVTETHLSTITLPTIGQENVLYMIGENSNTSEIYIYEKDHYKQITWNYNNLEIINGGHA